MNSKVTADIVVTFMSLGIIIFAISFFVWSLQTLWSMVS